MQLNLLYNIILLALFRNCLNEMFTLTEVSKVSDAVNISRRLLRSNPKKWCAIFPLIFLFNQITPNSAYLLLNAGHFALKNLKLYLLDKSVPFDHKEKITFHLLLSQTTNQVFEVLIEAFFQM